MAAHDVRVLADAGNALWMIAGTRFSGDVLVRQEKATGRRTFFDELNTPLPDAPYLSLARTGDGVLWIGTSAGLVRYDGVHWTVHTPANGPLPAYEVTALTAEGQVLWVGTSRGLVRYDGGRWSTFTGADVPVAATNVTALATAHGVLWVGTTEGLARYDGARWTTHDVLSTLPYDEVRALAPVGPDEVWIGTAANGLLHLSGDDLHTYQRTTYGTPVSGVEVLALDPTGDVWAGDGRLLRVEGEQLAVVLPPEGTGSYPARLQALLAAGPGDLWIGAGNGLWRWRGGAYELQSPGLPTDWINALALTPDGALWVGTDHGLARLSDETWAAWLPYAEEDAEPFPLPETEVTSLAVTPDGALWIGGLGLARYDGAGFTVYDATTSPLPPGRIEALAVGAGGSLWIGTQEGLVHYDGAGWTRYAVRNLPAPVVQALTVTPDGAVWIGTEAGLVRFDGQTWTRFSGLDLGLGFDPYRVKELAVDARGGVWAGVGTAGSLDDDVALLRFDGAAWRRYVPPHDPAVPLRFGAFVPDASGGIWVGLEDGLTHFDGETWTRYSAANAPLPPWQVRVSALALGPEGSVWMGSRLSGLYRFTPSVAPPPLPESSSGSASIYPNPLIGQGTLQFVLSVTESVRVEVFDVLGRRRLDLPVGELAAGPYAVPLLTDALSAGIYFVRLTRGHTQTTLRLTVVR